jgi:hypothetical protein
MARQMTIRDWEQLPPWQQRMFTYLELSPHPRPRPTWTRVAAGLMAVLFLVSAVNRGIDGAWLPAAGFLLLTAVMLRATRRMPTVPPFFRQTDRARPPAP